jgi:hypothetical protein
VGIGDWISNAAKFAKKAPPAVPAARMAELAKKAREAAPAQSASLADKFPLLDDAAVPQAIDMASVSYPKKGQFPFIPGVKWTQSDGYFVPDNPQLVAEAIAGGFIEPPMGVKPVSGNAGPVGSVPKQADKGPEGYTLAPLDDDDPADVSDGGFESQDYASRVASDLGVIDWDEILGGFVDPDSGDALVGKKLKKKMKEAKEMAGTLGIYWPGDPKPVDRRPEENIRDYIARLREMDKNEEYKPAVAKAVSDLEERLAGHVSKGNIRPLEPGSEDVISATTTADKVDAAKRGTRNQITRDYIDYLASSGVDQRTLDDIASGALPMDPQSRMARAEQHDLDPKAIWFRWDRPLKTDMKGFTGAALAQPELRRYKSGQLGFIDLAPSKEGLVYTSHNPGFAKRGVQMPYDEVISYPLLGPKEGIAGIDNMPPSAYDTFRSRMQSLLLKKFPDKHLYPENPGIRRAHMRSHHLAEPLVEPQYVQGPLREATLDSLRRIGPSSHATHEAQGTIPHFSTAEDRKVYTEPLMASGAKGTLVRDETGLATAFTPAGARMLRRADLAPLDTRFKGARNLLQSLLVPAVIAGGASSLPSTDSRRTENR